MQNTTTNADCCVYTETVAHGNPYCNASSFFPGVMTRFLKGLPPQTHKQLPHTVSKASIFHGAISADLCLFGLRIIGTTHYRVN